MIRFLMELVAELMIRTYFESQEKSPYIVRKLWNFARSGGAGPNRTEFSQKRGV